MTYGENKKNFQIFPALGVSYLTTGLLFFFIANDKFPDEFQGVQ